MKRFGAIMTGLLVTFLVFPANALAAATAQGDIAGGGSSLGDPVNSSALIASSGVDAFAVVALGSALFLAVTALTYLHRRPRGSSSRPSAATGI